MPWWSAYFRCDAAGDDQRPLAAAYAEPHSGIGMSGSADQVLCRVVDVGVLDVVAVVVGAAGAVELAVDAAARGPGDRFG